MYAFWLGQCMVYYGPSKFIMGRATKLKVFLSLQALYIRPEGGIMLGKTWYYLIWGVRWDICQLLRSVLGLLWAGLVYYGEGHQTQGIFIIAGSWYPSWRKIYAGEDMILPHLGGEMRYMPIASISTGFIMGRASLLWGGPPNSRYFYHCRHFISVLKDEKCRRT